MAKEEFIKKRPYSRKRLRRQDDKLSGFVDVCEDEGPETYIEQNRQSPNWASVHLSREMYRTHTDVEIMEFVIRSLRSKRSVLGDRCLYQPGNRTISFPIRPRKSLEGHWAEAVTVAKAMLNTIQGGGCVFDRQILFVGHALSIDRY